MIKMALVLWNNKELRIYELYEHESKMVDYSNLYVI